MVFQIYPKHRELMLGDDGNAYRIEIEDDDKTNVYAPIDVDTYVRARP